jgi:hypothetical protein
VFLPIRVAASAPLPVGRGEAHGQQNPDRSIDVCRVSFVVCGVPLVIFLSAALFSAAKDKKHSV